jgi:vacuolar-type H+-ATPase subunit C/Vma6
VALEDTVGFQRRLVQELVWEFSEYLGCLRGAGASVLAWVLARFEIENVKVMLRSLVSAFPYQQVQKHLIPLPHPPGESSKPAPAVKSLDDVLDRLPAGMDGKRLKKIWNRYREPVSPFFLESTLDQVYFQELIARTGRLSRDDREVVEPLAAQDVDTFHLMVVLRGRFHYRLDSEALLPLHVRGARISYGRCAAMLGAPGAASALRCAIGQALDDMPFKEEPGAGANSAVTAAGEALAWKRFLRLANRTFRCGHMALGQVIGYAGLRRVEVINLITLSEAIRAGVPAADIRPRLIPRSRVEASYV